MNGWMLSSMLLVAVSVSAQQGDTDAIRFPTANSGPAVLVTVKPEYTERAKKAGLEGWALVALTIGEDGIPKDLQFESFHQGSKEIQDPLGLDEMAVAAARQFRFKPAMKEGKPTSFRGKVTVPFRLPKATNPDVEQH